MHPCTVFIDSASEDPNPWKLAVALPDLCCIYELLFQHEGLQLVAGEVLVRQDMPPESTNMPHKPYYNFRCAGVLLHQYYE